MKSIIQVLFFVAAFSNGIDLVFGENKTTMFRRNLNDELKTLMDGKNKLDDIIQTAINDHPGNTALQSVRMDFIMKFHSTFNEVCRLHKMYTTCCEMFDPTYVKYFQKLSATNDKEKLARFQTLAKQWEGRILINFMVKGYIRYIQKMVTGLEDENSILNCVVNEAKYHKRIEIFKDDWEAAKGNAWEMSYHILLNLPKHRCLPLVEEFESELKQFD
ncbi:uncharacterized protein LOC116337137 [Contarinia nasturtii]|uniref:uncharacterized protein LOC116337137 n=1 Tax=Contarinia nasturtii TaxID=265458 RepID=UPI0012D3D621|nr:uncharacterized protein LOC116337137 [Contarinia nasturtii]